MKTITYSALAFALAATASNAATMSLSFWGYDQYAGNTLYYSHYEVTTDELGTPIASIDLYDRGWGNTPGGKSAYHYMSSVGNVYNNTGLARSIGWHRYEISFNDISMLANLLVDGNIIRSGAYTTSPTFFRVAFHDYYGGVQETVIDDFEYRLDGNLIYRQDFESTTLGSGWTPYPNAGTYIASGDISNPHSGTGSLALGAIAGGNLANIITFDLTSVPEPSTGCLVLLAGCAILIRRGRRA